MEETKDRDKTTLIEADLFIKGIMAIFIPVASAVIIGAGVTINNIASEQVRQADAIDRMREGILQSRGMMDRRITDHDDQLKEMRKHDIEVDRQLLILRGYK